MIDCTLDSTTLVDILRDRPSLNSILAPFFEPGLSHVTLGELLLGALKSSHPGEAGKALQLVKGLVLLHGDETTAVIYAGIRRDLEKNGNPIPQNDIWIAAASMQADVPLITRDRHFRHIPRLKLLDYG